MHVPVLLNEAVDLLSVREGGTYIDATLGGGGHAEAILSRAKDSRLLGIDRDAEALVIAAERLRPFGHRVRLMQGNMENISALHRESGLPAADGVLADLGVSSFQLDEPERGFSFDRAGPLDMRMDRTQRVTAAVIVNETQEQDLADLIFELGEERHSRRIARAIVKARPIRTTAELAQAVRGAIPSRTGLRHLDPATRTFMALRIAVNDELKSLDRFLAGVLSVLAPAGRVVIISFHSLEDRRVKRAFARWKGEGRARLVTPKAVRPAGEEVESNPRSRSAKLRGAEKAA